MPQPDSSNLKPRADAAPNVKFGLSDTAYQLDQILGKRYRVLSLLGRGGMGIVYKVEQIFLGKELALKTIDKACLSEITVKRFAAEARAASAVDHPNIVSIHDFGLLDDETPFLVMELVEGETLGSRLQRGALSVEEAIPIFIQVCFGLAHAHSCGVVHRDIKPNNLMLMNDVPTGLEGSVKILDFGIAKLVQHADGEIQALTKTGEIFGSPLYMSPEQCMGMSIDHRSDIYSLGCVLFEALTGSPPYVGDTALSTMRMHQSAEIPTLKQGSLGAEFPKELEDLVRCMLAKEPAKRCQNLGQAAHVLAAIKQGDTSEASSKLLNSNRSPKVSTTKTTISMRRNSFVLVNAGVALVSIALTLLFNGVSGSKPKTEATSTHELSETLRYKMSEDTMFVEDVASGASTVSKRFATDDAMKAFKGYTKLQSLETHDGTVTDKGLENLSASKMLRLGLSHCEITSVDNISKMTYLQHLNLTGNKIGARELKQLTNNLKQLSMISIKECPVSEKDLLGLADSTSLTEVSISSSQCSEETLTELRKKMPQCKFHIDNRTLEPAISLIDQSPNKIKTKFEKARKRLEVAEQANPLNVAVPFALYDLSTIAIQQKHFQESTELVHRAASVLTQSGNIWRLPAFLSLQAGIEAGEGHKQEALALSKQAIQITLDTSLHSLPLTMETLDAEILLPTDLNDYDTVIETSKAALAILKDEPSLDRNWVKRFSYLAGSFYLQKGRNELAEPYLKTYYALSTATKLSAPLDFIRAEIQYAHTVKEINQRQALYQDAIQRLEALKLPVALDLKMHYMDACFCSATLYANARKHKEAIQYIRKGLLALQGQTRDPDGRKMNYAKLLVDQLKQSGDKAESEREALKYGIKSQTERR